MSLAGDTVNAANRARQAAVDQAQKATEKIRDMNDDRLAEIEARREKEERKALDSTDDENNSEAEPRPSRRGLRFRRDKNDS